MWQQILDAVSEQVNHHWIKVLTGGAFMLVGWWFGKRRAKSEWQKREFWDRINFSLNTIEDDKLLIRTLIEKSLTNVFLNSVAVEAIKAAAKQTSEKNPILPLSDDDYWYYLNAVLNEVSEQFSDGLIRRDLGQPVTKADYLICLTCEVAGAIRTHKVRVMLIQKSTLQNLPAERPVLENPNHTTRWDTLYMMAQEWKKNPKRFLEMEICT